MDIEYQSIVFIYLSARRRFGFSPAHTRELIATPSPGNENKLQYVGQRA